MFLTRARVRHAGLMVAATFLGTVSGTLGVLSALPAPAFAQDPAAVSKVQELNKKALEAYDNLEPEESRKLLLQALEVCAAAGLANHPWKARTHLNLGVVLMGGFKNKDLATKQFKRALEIQPDIKLSKALATPETASAFDEAKADGKPAEATPEPKPTPVETPKPEPAKPEPTKAATDEPPASFKGIFHRPVTESKEGEAIVVRAAVSPDIDFKKVIVAYRPEGLSDYLQREMAKDDKGWFVARIPEVATNGGLVSYYIEARDKTEKPLANNGSSAEPHVVSLSATGGAPAPVASISEPRSEEPRAGGDEGGAPTIWFGIGVGVGYGYAKGQTEVNQFASDKEFSGMAPANLVHFTPEISYAYTRNLLFSVQGRIQLVSGATTVQDARCTENANDTYGSCSPAKGAIAVLGKATYLFGEGTFRPFVSGAVGVGEMRHLVKIEQPLPGCGVTPPDTGQCVDTVLAGPIFLGPGAGVQVALGDSSAFIAAAQLLAGFPKTTANLDLNASFAFGF